MSTLSPNWSELLDPVVSKIYGTKYGEFPEEYSKVFEVATSSKAFERSLQMTDFGLAVVKPEGAGITYDDPIKGLKNDITHITYGLGFVVSAEMWEDDLHNVIAKLPKGLAKSVRATIETVAANVINRAQTAAYTGADGKVLAATDHPLLGGGTYQNRPTNNADLSMTSWEQAHIDVAAYVTDRGLPMPAKITKLVIHPANTWTAQQLLQSTLDPESNYNAINPARGDVPFTVMHYLTDPDAWAAMTDVEDGLIAYWRRKPSFAKDNDFDSENAKWKTTFRFSVGWNDPRQIYYSAGA